MNGIVLEAGAEKEGENSPEWTIKEIAKIKEKPFRKAMLWI